MALKMPLKIDFDGDELMNLKVDAILKLQMSPMQRVWALITAMFPGYSPAEALRNFEHSSVGLVEGLNPPTEVESGFERYRFDQGRNAS